MADGNNEPTVLTRVKYYKGQPLTAQDFQDEQKYHSEKLKLLLSRFPTGIIRGFEAEMLGTSLVLSTGIAVNANGDFLAVFPNQTVYVNDTIMIVESGGNDDTTKGTLTILQDAWGKVAGSQKIYVNLSPKLIEIVKANSLCDSTAKNNRVEETVKITFDKSPDGPIDDPDKDPNNYVTIAVLNKIGDNNYEVVPDSPVVVNAGILDESQVTFNDNGGHDHSGGTNGQQIRNESIPLNEITTDRLATGARLPPTGPAGGDLSGEYPDPKIGQNVITINNLARDFQLPENQIEFNDTQGHNHSGVAANGTPIGSNGIADYAVVSDKIAAAPENGISSDADTPGGNGIRTSHIRNKAVTLAKLADEINFMSSDSAAGGDLIGTYPNPTIARWDGKSAPDDDGTGQGIRTSCIRDNAVTSSKIALWDDGSISDDPDPAKKGIRTSHIRNGAVTSNKIAEWDGKENPSTKGITTNHLRNSAITANKVSVAVQNEVPSAGFKNSDFGIFTAHIQPNAVTSSKIAEWDPNQPSVNGIQVTHLGDGAVASNKISIAVESEIPAEGFTDHNKGIYTAHVQPKAITLAKLGDDVNFIKADSEAGGEISGTYDNLSISGGAVTSDKIAFANADTIPDGKVGIRTEHLRNGAVTPNKLGIVNTTVIAEMVISTITRHSINTQQNGIILVIPLYDPTAQSDTLQWSTESIQCTKSGGLIHTIVIVPPQDTAGKYLSVKYSIRVVDFGALNRTL